MLGLTNHVVVIVVNAIYNDEKRKTNWFDTTANTIVAATNSIYATTGNNQVKSDIQKQAYPIERVPNIRSAFGLTCTNFNTHTPFISGKQVSLDTKLELGIEVVLVKNGLRVDIALKEAGKHKILPMRTCRVIPSRLQQ